MWAIVLQSSLDSIISLGACIGLKEDQVRSEDRAERMRAERPDAPHMASKDELKGRHGVDMSKFWGSLEKEDAGIEESVDLSQIKLEDGLNEFPRLSIEFYLPRHKQVRYNPKSHK